MELDNLISEIKKVKNDILDYILNTEHYIFNWISHKEVQDFIKEYPDDYEDLICLNIVDVNITPKIRICFEDHPNNVEYIEKYTFLPTFRDSTKAKWLRWDGKIKEKQILIKEQEVEYLKKQLEKTEKELEELKRN